MAIDVIDVALSNGYTDQEIAGGGAIKGKNCVVDDISKVGDKNTVRFKWTLDNGTVLTGNMEVLDGAKGDKGDPGRDGVDGSPGAKGDTGNTGAQGPAGTAATIAVGTVISGESPSVINGGTSSAAIFNFVLPKGDKGDRGPTGANGKDGQDGKSFEIKARFATYAELIAAYPTGPDNPSDAYFVGTTSNPDLYVWVTEDSEWVNNGPIAGVKGDKGDKGDTGDDGFSPVANVTKVGNTATITVRDKTGQTSVSVTDGEDGAPGLSAYEVAVEEGYVGTEEEWLASLKGEKGDDGAGGAYFGTSNTSGATATKVVTTTNGNFELFTGADIIIKFGYDDTAGSVLLKIDGTAAKAVKQNGSDIEAGVLTADNVYEFVYTGTYFEMVSGGSSMAIEDIDQSDFTLVNKQLSLQPSRRMFSGTKAEYEALSADEKKKYDYLASPEREADTAILFQEFTPTAPSGSEITYNYAYYSKQGHIVQLYVEVGGSGMSIDTSNKEVCTLPANVPLPKHITRVAIVGTSGTDYPLMASLFPETKKIAVVTLGGQSAVTVRPHCVFTYFVED